MSVETCSFCRLQAIQAEVVARGGNVMVKSAGTGYVYFEVYDGTAGADVLTSDKLLFQCTCGALQASVIVESDDLRAIIGYVRALLIGSNVGAGERVAMAMASLGRIAQLAVDLHKLERDNDDWEMLHRVNESGVAFGDLAIDVIALGVALGLDVERMLTIAVKSAERTNRLQNTKRVL